MLDKSSEFCSLDYDVPITRPTKIMKKLYAKALYDNVADSPDELAFRKGDILAVIEQDTDGLVGWWLCTLRGRQGLCPGNRLRILNSYDSGCFSPSPASSPCPSLAASTATLNSSICSADIYENTSIISGTGSQNSSLCINNHSNNHRIVTNSSGYCNANSISQLHLNASTIHLPNNANTNNATTHGHGHANKYLQEARRQGTRRSWHVSPNKVITPQRQGDVYVYQTPLASQQCINTQHSASSCNSLDSTQSIYSNTISQQIYENLPYAKISEAEYANYDIPKPVVPINYDTPKNLQQNKVMANLTPILFEANKNNNNTVDVCNTDTNTIATTIQEENYDTPRPLLNQIQQFHSSLTLSSSNSSLLTNDNMSLSFSSSNRSLITNMSDYDVPRRNPIPVRGILQQHQQQQQQQPQHLPLLRSNYRTNINDNCPSYDFPTPTLQTLNHTSKAVITKELPLELSSALETLAKLQTETTTAITRLLSFVSPGWRTPDKLEPVLMEVKLAAVRLRTALHDLTEFGEGTLGNATRSEDRVLSQKLRPIIRALKDSNKLVRDSCDQLELRGSWSLENLIRQDDKNSCKPPDSLDQLVACAQTLTEDVRSTASFIQGNASLLFKRHLPELLEEDAGTSPTSDSNTDTKDLNKTEGKSEGLDDYEYVSFEMKDAATRKNQPLREVTNDNIKNRFDTVLMATENTVITASQTTTLNPTNGKKSPTGLTEKDKLVVRYYAIQISTHMGNLRQAIDSFLETVEKNQPPKFFIAYAKFVVVSAHNLVSIGDIVYRNVSKIDLKDKILRCTDALSEALKLCVLKSKHAAAHFPSVVAVQEMVDSVVDISHLASDLKTVMLHAVQLTL